MTDEQAPRPNLRLAAVSYARLGLLVFPCAPRSKTPLTPRGCKDASDDLDQVTAWWTQWPDANIGIACGEMSGLFVVDIDGPEGEASLAALEKKNGALPVVPEVRTGKGRHLYFRHFPGARNSASKLGDFIDTRGDGGYVIAPPSLHPSGAQYAWAPGAGPRDRRRPDAPEWLAAANVKREAPRRESTWAPSSEKDAERSRKYCLGALESAHRELATTHPGARNERLRDAAYALGGYVPTGFLEVREIADALIEACKANGAWADDGEHKCMSTLHRAMDAGIANPRDIPAPRPRPFDQAEGDMRTPEEVVPLEKPRPERKWPKAAELAMGLAALGAALTTGFKTLDEWLRGGLRQGKLVPIAGAPGAGKTLLATQLAHGYHDLGHPVCIYAVDEARDSVIVRWGQQCGMEREALEAAQEPARRTLAQCFESGLVEFIDPEEATLDEVGAWLVERARELEMPGVLVVDSIQTCRIEGGEQLDPRARIDAVVMLLKRLRKAGLLVLATSEVSRGWYRSAADKMDPLAAFKESGSIEYALDIGIVLESVKDETGQVDVWVPKSRIGRADRSAPALRVSIDFARATMREIDKPEEGDGEAYEPDFEPGEIESVANEIVRALLMSPGEVTTRKDLERAVPRSQRVTSPAVSLLLRSGRITGGRGKAFRVVKNGGQE